MLSRKSIPIPKVTAGKSENQLIAGAWAHGRRWGSCESPARLGSLTAWRPETTQQLSSTFPHAPETRHQVTCHWLVSKSQLVARQG